MKLIKEFASIPRDEPSMAIVQRWSGALREYYLFIPRDRQIGYVVIPIDSYIYMSMSKEDYRGWLKDELRSHAEEKVAAEAVELIMKDYDEPKSS
jgi:hypothetical protein